MNPWRTDGRGFPRVSVRCPGWAPLAALVACGEPAETTPRPEPEPEPTGYALEEGPYSGPLTFDRSDCASDLGISAWEPYVWGVTDTRATLLLRDGVQITCVFDGPNEAGCPPFEYDLVSPAGSYLHVRSEPALTVTSDESFDLAESLTVTCNTGSCPELDGASCTADARGQYTPQGLWWDPIFLWVSGEFGYDRDSRTVIPFRRDGVEVPIRMVLTVTDTENEEGCVVVLEHEAPAAPELYTSAYDPSFRFLGVKVPGGAWRVGDGTTCDTGGDEPGTREWDPYRWGEDAAATLAGQEWGLGVGPEEDMGGYYGGPLPAIPSSFGGGFFASKIVFDYYYGYDPLPMFVPWNRATGCALDATGAVIGSGDDCEPISPEAMEAALLVGELPSGAYTIHEGVAYGVNLVLE